MAERARRQLLVVFALLVVASAALWGSSRLTWFATVEQRPGGGSTVRAEDGAQYAPALLALAVLALAGIAGVLATAGLPRRVVGVLLALAGVGALVQAVRGAGGSGVAYLSQQPDELGRALDQEPFARGLAGLAGLMLLLVGALLVVRGHRMPRLGARYRTPGAARQATDPDRHLWQALDAGEDPTTERHMNNHNGANETDPFYDPTAGPSAAQGLASLRDTARREGECRDPAKRGDHRSQQG